MKIDPNKVRGHILDMVHSAKSGHIGGSFSMVDIVSFLYSEYPGLLEQNKDKFILSKGHAVPALYAIFYELGLIKDLSSFRQINSKLQGHPDHNRLDLLHATTGSLGQGLSIAIGHALAYKLQGKDHKVFCVLGDGEMQEGQIWEAMMLAPKYKLTNLVCFLDRNGSQNDGLVEDILSLGHVRSKASAFGWNAVEIDGHSEKAFRSVNRLFDTTTKPLFVILNTVKGKGVSFMETKEWHAKAPNDEEYEKAIKELGLNV